MNIQAGQTVYKVVEGYSNSNSNKYHLVSRVVKKIRKDGKFELDSAIPGMRSRILIHHCAGRVFHSSWVEALNAFGAEVDRRMEEAKRQIEAAQAASIWVAQESIRMFCGKEAV